MSDMSKKRPVRKVRVDFRQNRQVRQRQDDWTQRYRADEDKVVNAQAGETVRAKGDLSRKRTILVDGKRQPVVDASLWKRGLVTKVHGLICYVRDADARIWECTVRRILRTRSIATRAPVTVGDQVWFSDHTQASAGRPVGVVERVGTRTSRLSRRDRRQREQTIVANADQLLAIVSIAEPKLRPHLVDRYIVAALSGQLRPVLCFNKMDLLTADAPIETDDQPHGRLSTLDVIDEFRTLGYACLCTSAVTGVGLDELRAALKDRTTVLSGQSGVGKSTLLNALQPGLELPVQPVSDGNEKGRHTTTLAELFALDFGGFVIDTPGIRAFDMWAVEPGELEAFFVEFIPYVQRCRFHDCTHRSEDGCAVVTAVEDGEISARRYYSYLKMFEDV